MTMLTFCRLLSPDHCMNSCFQVSMNNCFEVSSANGPACPSSICLYEGLLSRTMAQHIANTLIRAKTHTRTHTHTHTYHTLSITYARTNTYTHAYTRRRRHTHIHTLQEHAYQNANSSYLFYVSVRARVLTLARMNGRMQDIRT